MNQGLEDMPLARPDTLVHALQAHQLELEAQNEELRRTQRELDLTRARYFDLYDLAPVGYFTISDTETILEANLTAAHLLGLQGQTLVDLPIRNFVFAADQDIYDRHRQELADTGLPLTCELRMVKNGEIGFWAQLTATRGQDACGKLMHRLVVTNIDESRRNKERLRISDSALKAITQGVLIITPELIVISVNAAFLTMTGYTEAELIGQNCTIFNGPLTEEGVMPRFFESMAQKRVFSGEVFKYRKDGSGFWNAFCVSPVLDAQGQVSHLISTNTDISARKAMDEDLHRKNLELQAATNRAEKANLAKSEFLSNMSHDLRSPLNAIVGFAQLLATGSPPPTTLQQSNIDRILAGGWYLLKLINEILDLALIESGKLALSLQVLALAQVLRECRNLTEAHAESEGIALRFETAGQPLWLVADPVRLQQVIVNLLSNAIKYNRPGGAVTVRVHASARNRLRISVHDTGEGLAPDKLVQLFEPFNRLGRENSVTEGTGIGLVVTKRLAELMGGTIGVSSVLGVGSEFWVEFQSAPRPVGAATPLHRPVNLRALSARTNQPPCSVLYVEDNQANQDLVAQILARRPALRLYSAMDGPQGIAMAQKHSPDVILMDINLPGMGGKEVLQLLRQDAATRHIPVVAVSANAMPFDVVHGLAAGFFHYLTKPFEIDRFLKVLDLALGQAIRARSAQS